MMLEQLSLYLAIDETLFYLAILIPGECMGRASDRAWNDVCQFEMPVTSLTPTDYIIVWRFLTDTMIKGTKQRQRRRRNGQWLWHTWQSCCFRHHRTLARIRTSAIRYIDSVWVVKKRRKRGREGPILVLERDKSLQIAFPFQSKTIFLLFLSFCRSSCHRLPPLRGFSAIRLDSGKGF